MDETMSVTEGLDFTDFDGREAEAAEEGQRSPEGVEESAPAEETQKEPAGDAPPEADAKRHKIKFLGEEREMTEEELLSYAQKGLNYDHVARERDQLKEAKEFKLLDKFAAASGMTRDQLLTVLEESAKQREMQELMDKQVPREVAERLVALEREARERKEQEERLAEEERRREAFRAFVKEYPEVGKFPDEVAAAIAKGETPVNAYRAYEVRQLKAKLAELEQKEAGRKKAIGPMGDTAAPPAEDDFLSAFWKE